MAKIRCYGNIYVDINETPVTYAGKTLVSVRVMHECGGEPKKVGEFDIPVCNVPAFVTAVLNATVPVLSRGELDMWPEKSRDEPDDARYSDSDSVGFVIGSRSGIGACQPMSLYEEARMSPEAAAAKRELGKALADRLRRELHGYAKAAENEASS